MCDRNFENLLDEGFHFLNFSFGVEFLSPSNTHIVTFNLVGEKEGGFVWFLRIFFSLEVTIVCIGHTPL